MVLYKAQSRSVLGLCRSFKLNNSVGFSVYKRNRRQYRCFVTILFLITVRKTLVLSRVLCLDIWTRSCFVHSKEESDSLHNWVFVSGKGNIIKSGRLSDMECRVKSIIKFNLFLQKTLIFNEKTPGQIELFETKCALLHRKKTSFFLQILIFDSSKVVSSSWMSLF